LHQKDEFDLPNLPQALNNNREAASGNKRENLLPLSFLAILKISSLNPTISKS